MWRQFSKKYLNVKTDFSLLLKLLLPFCNQGIYLKSICPDSHAVIWIHLFLLLRHSEGDLPSVERNTTPKEY